MRVAALIPAYQAAAHVGGVVDRLRALPDPPDVLVVDDGSRDGTSEAARSHGARVERLPENRGKGHALLAGFALLRDYDGVVTLDADGQHPPGHVPEFVAAARAGGQCSARHGRRAVWRGSTAPQRLAVPAGAAIGARGSRRASQLGRRRCGIIRPSRHRARDPRRRDHAVVAAARRAAGRGPRPGPGGPPRVVELTTGSRRRRDGRAEGPAPWNASAAVRQ